MSNAAHLGKAGYGFGISIAALALRFFWLELRAVVRPVPWLNLSRGGMGEFAINLDQISRLAQREAEHISGKREFKTICTDAQERHWRETEGISGTRAGLHATGGTGAATRQEVTRALSWIPSVNLQSITTARFPAKSVI